MAIQTLHDTGTDYDILSQYDGGVYSVATTDCVIKGIGDEFALTYSSNSLDVQFSAGSQAIIGGSFFKVTALESVTLSANSTIYLCANIDLSRPNGQRGQFVQRTSSNMRSDNINGNGISRDLLLYVITTSASGVSNVVDKRKIMENALPIQFGQSTTQYLRNDGTWAEPRQKVINVQNLITTVAGGTTYTASQDCFACYQNDGTTFLHYIDGVAINCVNMVFLRKGQSTSYPNTHNPSRILIYGCK